MINERFEAAYGAAANAYGTLGDGSATMFDQNRTSWKGVIIALHGRSLGANTWSPMVASGSSPQNPSPYDHIRRLMEHGYAVVALDAGGPFTWSNQTEMNVIDTAIPIANARFGRASNARVGLLGFSMGGLASLNYMKRQAAKVAGAAMWSALTDLSFEYRPAGYVPGYSDDGVVPIPTAQSEINTAFSCTTATYAAATAGFRIFDEYATWRNLRPIWLMHAVDDATVPIDQARAFVAGVNDPNVTLHETTTGGHGNFSKIDIEQLASFYDSLSW